MALVPKFQCAECGVQIFHENETTLKIQETIHSKFCRKNMGETHSYMHRDEQHMETFDSERENDTDGTPVLK